MKGLKDPKGAKLQSPPKEGYLLEGEESLTCSLLHNAPPQSEAQRLVRPHRGKYVSGERA